MGSYVWKLRQALGSQRILVAGVGLIVTNAEGKIWLGKRTVGGEWSYFGGAMELGDSTMDTVIKEMHEETGVLTTAEDWQLVGLHTAPSENVYTYPNGDEVQIVNHIFTLRYDGPIGSGADEEHSEFGLFDVDDLPVPMKPDSAHALRLYKAFLATGKVQVN